MTQAPETLKGTVSNATFDASKTAPLFDKQTFSAEFPFRWEDYERNRHRRKFDALLQQFCDGIFNVAEDTLQRILR